MNSPRRPRLPVQTVTSDKDAARNTELETVWFNLSAPTFTPLALVASTEQSHTQDVLDFAVALARVGATSVRSRFAVVNAMGVKPWDSERAVADIRNLVAKNANTLVVCDSPVINPGALPVLRSFDRVVVVVELGSTEGAHVAEIRRNVGPGRIVGALCLPYSSAGARRRAAKLSPATKAPSLATPAGSPAPAGARRTPTRTGKHG